MNELLAVGVVAAAVKGFVVNPILVGVVPATMDSVWGGLVARPVALAVTVGDPAFVSP